MLRSAFNLIGTEEGGFANAMKVLTASRPIIAASSLGACQLAKEIGYPVFKGKVAFGKPMHAKQMIQEKIANMEMLIRLAVDWFTMLPCFLTRENLAIKKHLLLNAFVTEAYGKMRR